MYIYYLLILILFFSQLLIYGKSNLTFVNLDNIERVNYDNNFIRKKVFYLVLATIFFSLIVAFRDNTVGTDTNAYFREFYLTYSIPFSSLSLIDFVKGEYGYKLLIMISHQIGINWRLFQFFYALLVSSSLAFFFYKYSTNTYVSCLLYITIGTFAMSLTGIRQSIAIALVLYAYLCLKKKKYILTTLLLFYASSVHYTSLIMVGLLILNFMIENLDIKIRTWIIIGWLIPITLFFFTDKILNKFSFMLLNKYEYSGYYNELNSTLNPIVIIMYITLFIYTFFGIYFHKRCIKNEEILFYVMSSLFVGCYLASGTVYMLARLSYYFSPYFIVLLTNTINYLPLNQKSKIIVEILLCFLCVLAFVISIPGNSYGIDNFIFSIEY